MLPCFLYFYYRSPHRYFHHFVNQKITPALFYHREPLHRTRAKSPPRSPQTHRCWWKTAVLPWSLLKLAWRSPQPWRSSWTLFQAYASALFSAPGKRNGSKKIVRKISKIRFPDTMTTAGTPSTAKTVIVASPTPQSANAIRILFQWDIVFSALKSGNLSRGNPLIWNLFEGDASVCAQIFKYLP